jgi:hypothetical protein
MPDKTTGSCLCGAVTYAVTEAPGGVIACHCADCQKAGGAAASHNIVVKTENLAVTSGTPKTFVKLADSGRTLTRFFCGDCGSPLFSRRKEMPEVTVVKAGTLDDKTGLKHVTDIWTASATGWIPDDPGVAHHEGNRPVPTQT